MVINALNSGAKTFMADFEGTYAEQSWTPKEAWASSVLIAGKG
jgi:malate synthase